jgi:hypothetical protein
VSVSDPTPNGDRIFRLGHARIDGSGNVVVEAAWSPPSDIYAPGGYGIISYAPDGGSTLIAQNASLSSVNHAGQIAGLQSGDGAPDVVRWNPKGRTIILDGNAKAPGGGWYVYGGIDDRVGCLASDGRIGVFAYSTDSDRSLFCADATGLHAVARTGETQAQPFTFLHQCDFVEQDMLFAANEVVPEGFIESTLAIYRGGANGVTRVIGPGDTVSHGTRVQRLRGTSQGYFSTNEHGSIVVAALTDVGETVLRHGEGSTIDSVDIQADGLVIEGIDAIGITTDRTVIAIVRQPQDDSDDDEDEDDDEQYLSANDDEDLEEEEDEDRALHALVASDGADARILALTGDPALPGGPYTRFSRLWVHGHRLWISAAASDGVDYVLQYDLADSSWRRIVLPGITIADDLDVLSISPSGRILYGSYAFRPTNPTASSPRRLVDASGGLSCFPKGTTRQICSPSHSTITATSC